MEIRDLPISYKKLLAEMFMKKKVSANTQTIFSKFSFYLATSDLKRLGLIELNGTFKGGEIKEWRLTEKGKEIAKMILDLSEILKSIEK